LSASLFLCQQTQHYVESITLLWYNQDDFQLKLRVSEEASKEAYKRSGIMGVLQDIYIKLLVWLGAAPPEGYEHLIGAQPSGPKEYTLKEGDTLFSVAREFGTHYELIAKANNIEDYNSVEPGQTLPIPPQDWTPPDEDEPEQPEEPPAELEPIEETESSEETAELETPAETTEETAPVAPADITETDTDEAEWSASTEPVSELDLQTADDLLSEDKDDAPESVPVLDEDTTVPEPPSAEYEAETAAEAPVAIEEEEAGEVFRYEVQRGDTLSAIARNYGITVKELVEANNIIDPNRIFPGQKLIIPGYMHPKPQPEPESPEQPEPFPTPDVSDFFVYTVAGGDTLSSIAKRYGITLRELIEANNIDNPNLIHVGQKLVIPGILQPPESPAEAPAVPKPETPVTQPPSIPPEYDFDPDFPPIGPLDAVRALYVSYFAVGHAEFRKHIFNLLDTTEFNAVVIDAKGDHGWISYPTNVALAHEIGANRPTAKDFDELLGQLKAKGIYTIARIVTFKDSSLAKTYPEFAVKTSNGAIWQDREGQSWSDPFLKPVWDYNIQLAIEAAQKGFDEVQFDYVRFPTPSQAGEPYFSQDVSKETRIAAITGYLSTVRGQTNPLGVKLGADTFGYTCWREDDTIIGQDIDKMGQYLDVLCPMLYPSTFGAGIPGYKFAIAYPYEIVYQSALRAVNRLKPLGCQVRPWIQDFPDYRFDKRVYGKEEIQAQIKGAFDSESSGFMVWDPRVKYTKGAYAPLTVRS
jgi:LysM repeat protein